MAAKSLLSCPWVVYYKRFFFVISNGFSLLHPFRMIRVFAVKDVACSGPRPTLYCPHFDERLLKCVRLMNKHNFNVAFNPIDCHGELRGAQRRKHRHRYAYKIVPSEPTPSPSDPEKLEIVSFHRFPSFLVFSYPFLFFFSLERTWLVTLLW